MEEKVLPTFYSSLRMTLLFLDICISILTLESPLKMKKEKEREERRREEEEKKKKKKKKRRRRRRRGITTTTITTAEFLYCIYKILGYR
jgi:flagellar biosynthesis protein FlhB